MKRYPQIYTELPSTKKQLAVYSMTMADEFILKTPDALMNGHATVDIIKNCCPEIQNGWLIQLTDLNTILSAIRIASGNAKIDISIKCPHCKKSETYDLDLQQYTANLNAGQNTWDSPIEVNSQVSINLIPPCYKVLNDWAIAEFKIGKQLQQVQHLEDENLKLTYTSQLVEKFNILQKEKLLSSINEIYTREPHMVVNDRSDIIEYINCIDISEYNKLMDEYKNKIKACQLPNIQIKCANEECAKDLDVPFELDFCNVFRNQILHSDNDQIKRTVDKMEKDSRLLSAELIKLMWYMRGSITYEDAMNLTTAEKKIVTDLIKENLETTKKTHMPFF
jgi:hypothetical protein